MTILIALNQSAERLFIEIEDHAVRVTRRAIAAAPRRRPTQVPTAAAGRIVDAELRRESNNPLRGWRWV